MIIIPKERPVLEKLNSYYIIPQKLLEHCQGEFGSGIIHFDSHSAEGLVIFDEDEVLNGVLVSDKTVILGQQALNLLLELGNSNFTINVFRIAPQLIDFWVQMPTADTIYSKLNTEFTDFEVLFEKMKSEKLTGFFNISLNDQENGALYFFSNGKVVGGSFSWENTSASDSKENHEKFVTRLKTEGGTFDVNKLSPEKRLVQKRLKGTSDRQNGANVIEQLEELLIIVEDNVLGHTRKKENFSLLLKNKFVQKATRYPCLDPFAAEFEYANRKIAYTGTSSEREVVCGVIESLKELVEELGIFVQVMDAVGPWKQKYEQTIKTFKIEF